MLTPAQQADIYQNTKPEDVQAILDKYRDEKTGIEGTENEKMLHQLALAIGYTQAEAFKSGFTLLPQAVGVMFSCLFAAFQMGRRSVQ